MTLNALFATLSVPMGGADYVKSQNAFAQYYPGFGFFGILNMVETNTMYKVKKDAESTLAFTGTPVVLPMAMEFAKGWNYLPCPYQTQTSLTHAFPASGPWARAWKTSDLIKSQMMFSTYYVCLPHMTTRNLATQLFESDPHIRPGIRRTPCASLIIRGDTARAAQASPPLRRRVSAGLATWRT
jgi:hypothetical protein